MARLTASADGNPNGLEEDAVYRGVLVTAKKVKSKNPQYPEDQIEVDWELNQGVTQRDWLAIRLGVSQSTKLPSKLRQMLNACAERPKDVELWFDPDTLEWGYDVDADDSGPYANLTPGMVVNFKGELRDDKYKITRYVAAGNGQAKAKSKAKPKPEAPLEVVDVDPDEIPF